MKNSIRLMTVLLSTILLNGCSSGGGSSSASKLSEVTAAAQGSWAYPTTTPCTTLTGGSNTTLSYDEKYVYSNNTASLVRTLYQNSNCTTPVLTMSNTATITFGNALSSGDGFEVDSVYSAATILPLTTAAANMINTMVAQNSNCAHHFVAGQTTSLSVGELCNINDSSNSNLGIEFRQSESFSIIKIDTNSTPNRLYAGDDSGANDGSTAAKRPTSFPLYYMEKQ